MLLLAALLSEICVTTNNSQASVTAFQGTLSSRTATKIPLFTPVKETTAAQKYSLQSIQCAILTRLYDTERSEAEMKLSAQLDPRDEGIISTASLEQLHGNVSTTTLVVQTENPEEGLLLDENGEIPLPTDNGGFSHTSQSRAKISAANKGKTPWNKGKTRSPEVKARIAAGVRAKNRDNFLKKLIQLGQTEEEYEAEKKEARRETDAERVSRKTEKGGYRPTEETKQKISDILKAKWASGEMKKRTIDPTKVRRGFKHTEETRAKISEALKQRWANDATYRANMVNKTTAVNGAKDTRKKISDTLKAKWQDPEFRATMLEKIRSRRTTSATRDASYRRKISDAMKEKWKDEDYRNKTTTSIRQRAIENARLRPPKPPKQPRKKAAAAVKHPTSTVGIQLASIASPRIPRKPRTTKKKPMELDENGELIKAKVKKVVKKKKKKTVAKRAAATTVDRNGDVVTVVKEPQKGPKKKKAKKEPDGSINRLRDERRDLYDLLYGDEVGGGNNNNNQPEESMSTSGLAAMLDLEDENLDTYDPYGLEDF